MLDLRRYEGGLDEVLDTARDMGVGHMLCVSVNLKDYPKMQALVEGYDQVSTSVGVHPNDHKGLDPDVDELVTLAAHPKVVAIGETGLDYFRSEGDLDWQRDRFRRHIAAAKACGKPLIIHSREARADTLRSSKRRGPRTSAG